MSDEFQRGLRLENLEVILNKKTIVRLDRLVAPGEILTVMGPSGAGKSTLLAAITGTLAPAFAMRGRLWLNGRDLSNCAPEKRQIGILLQETLLFPHLSVGGNLAFGLKASVRSKEARRARIDEALAQADLQGFIDRDPHTLSGGQKARVALLRTLLAAPCALLLDEPFSSIDKTLKRSVRNFVFTSARAQTLPVILVTHDDDDADAAGGDVVSVLGAPLTTD